MSNLIKEFKDFINRGNVVDLAVAVAVGAAFTAVVNSFANDIIGGIVGVLVGKPNLDSLSISINDGQIFYGKFLTALINFMIVAVAVFGVVKAINAMSARRKAPADESVEVERLELDVLEEILVELRRQP